MRMRNRRPLLDLLTGCCCFDGESEYYETSGALALTPPARLATYTDWGGGGAYGWGYTSHEVMVPAPARRAGRRKGRTPRLVISEERARELSW